MIKLCTKYYLLTFILIPFSCKVEDVSTLERREGLFIDLILLRSIKLGEYTNNPSVTEMIVLFNNGLTAFVQDTVVGTEFNSFRKGRVDELNSFRRFSQVDSCKLVKRTTSYKLANDSLMIYYLPENDKTMYFKSKIDTSKELFVSKLYAEMNGTIRNTIDIINDIDEVYEFKVIRIN